MPRITPNLHQDIRGMQTDQRAIIGASGLAMGLAALLLLGYWPHSSLFRHLPQQITWYLLSFAPASLLWLLWRLRRLTLTRSAIAILFGVGLLLRLCFALHPPALSTDIFRYLWEGRITNAGLDPYQLAPNDLTLAPLASEYPEHHHINHPEFRSVYPPNAMTLFRVAALFDTPGAFYVFKLMLVFAELGLFYLLLLGLTHQGQTSLVSPLLRLEERQIYALLYWLCPLSLIELSGSGHLDIFAILCLVLAYLHWTQNNSLLVGLLYSLGLFIKPYGVPLLPFFLFPPRGQCLRHWLKFIVGFSLGSLSCVPYWESFSSLAVNLSAFGAKLKFYAGPFELFFWLGGKLSDAPATTRWYEALQIGTRITAALSLLLLSWLCLRFYRSRGQSFAEASYWLLLFGLCCSPQVHPWYFLVVIVFGLIAGRVALFLASPLLVLSYVTYIDWHTIGVWHESTLLRVLSFGGILLAFTIEEARRR
jgi:alpha-1,6-mannosyltransferase